MVAEVMNFKETQILNRLRNVVCVCVCLQRNRDNFGGTSFSCPVCLCTFLFCSSCSGVLKLIQFHLG